jgi:NAD(P)H-hydrate epimerase
MLTWTKKLLNVVFPSQHMEKMLCLPRPRQKSHKGQNGVVLIIGGSRTYHGAPILSALAAMRFCDLVYFFSTTENASVLKKMKLSTPNVICVTKEKFAFALAHADCVLVGNGMAPDGATRRMAEKILKTKKKCVIDAAALRVLPAGLLHGKAILTPHAMEFEAAFGKKATEKNAREAAANFGCTILLKGKQDFACSASASAHIPGGNAGMTKGGTGDVLAGLLAAVYSHPSCRSPLRAACTASFLNKRAGEMLFRIMRYNFSSEDLALELAHAAWGLYK